ncbi:MAG: hypothetical protein ACYS83_08270 [Planctomycetota bacterium]
MSASKYKEIIQGVFKSYSSLLPPILIGLVGGLLFIPTQLMNNKLQKQIKTESISKGDVLQLLSGDVVSIRQWGQEQEYQQDYERDASEINLMAMQCTQRQLLSYEIFPEPKKDASVFIFDDFGRQFRGALERVINRVNAGGCPTKAELDEIRKSWSTKKSGKSGLLEVSAAIEDDLCREKAEEASVYIGPADLGGYKFWEEYKYAKVDDMNEALKNCWYSQLGYWIIEDVVDTIAAHNSGSNSVLESPVKRLLNMSFHESTGGSRLSSVSKVRTTGDKPSYILSVDDALANSCTRRICNNDIDVVHFKVAVVVGTKTVLPFMQKLCSAKQHKFRGWDNNEQERVFKHNQITILEYKIASIDREDRNHEYYRYGKDAVVELDLTCEYVFSKNGYDKVKPEAVKRSVKKSLAKLQKQEQRVLRPRRRPKPKTETTEDLSSLRVRR